MLVNVVIENVQLVDLLIPMEYGEDYFVVLLNSLWQS